MNPDFLNRAIELSRKGMEAGEGGPFGAVIVHNGRIIGEGVNTVIASNDPTNHAEMNAIRAAAGTLDTFDLSGCELYVNSEPCPMCSGAIYWARINKVYYANTAEDAARIGFDDSRVQEELTRAPEDRDIPFERIPEQTAQDVFDDWLRKEDRTDY